MSFNEYQKVHSEFITNVPRGVLYPRSIATTFSLALKRAIADCPGSERLLTILSYMAPQQVPLAIFKGTDLLERGDAVAALNGVSLAAVSEGCLTVHRLVQEVMRARVAAQGGVAGDPEKDIRAVAVALTLNVFLATAWT
jgi:hypothetical protein